MPTFNYSALNSSGKRTRGSIEANDRKAAQRKLIAKKLKPLSLKDAAASGAHASKGAKSGESPLASGEENEPVNKTPLSKRQFSLKFPTRSKANKKGTLKMGTNFLKRMLELHKSGMPIGDCVRLMQQRLSDPALKMVAGQLWRELSEGRPLHEALSQRPDLFPQVVIRMIEAGEATGKLAPILENVVEYLEEREAIRSKVLGGLAYPCFIVSMAVGVAIFLIVFLLPRIQRMLEGLGSDPNIFMRVLLGGSDLAINTGPFVVIGVIVGIIALFQWRRTETGRKLTDSWILRIPLVGPIIRASIYFQLSSLLGTLVESGINMTETLRLSERTLENSSVATRFKTVRTEVNEGAGISTALRRNDLFNALSLDILSIGENTGNLVHGLGEVNKSYRRELDSSLKLMTTIITSGAMAAAFTVVAFVALGMVTSIMQVSSSISLQ
ncbi:MAG: type II secretion system F family protein [Opitutales bacterium]